MTILETRTEMAPAEVLRRARSFFETCPTPASAFVEHAGDGYLQFRGEVGEIVIATLVGEQGTTVRGSASRGVSVVSRFLSLLGTPMEVRQTTHRHGFHGRSAARVEQGEERIQAGSDSAREPARAA